MPTDLPESIEVDVSVLETIGDGIYARDIVISDKVTLLDDPDMMIIVATAPAIEEEEEVEEELLEGELEGEEGEEGEAEEGTETEE